MAPSKKENSRLRAYKILIKGTVQSVGFRPSMVRAFAEYSGWVKNSSKGVEIYLECNLTENEVKRLILLNTPENAHIDSISITCTKTEKRIFSRFSVRNTEKDGGGFVQIPADIGICSRCAEELLDKENRRFLHPFINCTDCGPRFSIIYKTPYDRDSTTMRRFPLCDECKKEFEDPANRRFHAQPICCNKCGPSYLLLRNKKVLKQGIDAIKEAAHAIENGAVILLKGVGGFHLVCDAENREAITKLKNIKNRQKKPFALIARDLETAKNHCHISEIEEALLKGRAKPIVLLRKLERNFLKEATSNSPYLGVMLPYAGIHLILFHFSSIKFIVATSANITEKPLIFEDKEAISFCGADLILTYNRKIVRPLEDSIVMVSENIPLLLRAARGFAPIYLNLKTKPNILALGADLKNNIAISLKDKVIISQYTGNLEEFENYKRFTQNIKDFLGFFNFKPKITVTDKHPDYLSSNFAEENFKNIVKVQHHKAHFASVLYENKTEDDAIGVILDGTGYGDDGAIWGGEFFIKTSRTIERVGHLEYMPFAFGDRAIKEPYRLAMLWLYSIFKEEVFSHPLFEKHKELIPAIMHANTTKTSSAGRLFDVVSSILGISQTNSYEAEAAISLTYTAMKSETTETLGYSIKNFNIDFSETIKEMVSLNRTKSESARMFHNTFCDAIIRNTLNISRETGIKTVALSGGVFQNELVLSGTYSRLSGAGLNVIINRKVPINDGNIAIGQLYMVNFFNTREV